MIKFVIFDYDGKIYFNENNKLLKSYNAKDIYALNILHLVNLIFQLSFLLYQTPNVGGFGEY
jgi:3-deoxy-D-manno-octulosonate 8-phosphate phosphatase KdsC-like HAD superfamily phosphatase